MLKLFSIQKCEEHQEHAQVCVKSLYKVSLSCTVCACIIFRTKYNSMALTNIQDHDGTVASKRMTRGGRSYCLDKHGIFCNRLT